MGVSNIVESEHFGRFDIQYDNVIVFDKDTVLRLCTQFISIRGSNTNINFDIIIVVFISCVGGSGSGSGVGLVVISIHVSPKDVQFRSYSSTYRIIEGSIYTYLSS
jgi:ABC-type phosphonate transport system ATPase subunit